MGLSNTGKTQGAITFANNYFEKNYGKRFPIYITADKNPLDDYSNERAIIVDDVNDNSIERDLILSLTDNTTRRIGARYRNKVTHNLELVIITSILTPIQFFKRIGGMKDPVEQLVRRIDIIVEPDNRNSIQNDYYRYEVYRKTMNNALSGKDVIDELDFMKLYEKENVDFKFEKQGQKKIAVRDESQNDDKIDILFR